MRIFKLKAELANSGMQMRFKGNVPTDWEHLIQEYSMIVPDTSLWYDLSSSKVLSMACREFG